MTPETWKTIDFIRFYVMALLRGSPVELMRQRYPEWDLDVGPDHFLLRKKLAAAPPEAPAPQQTVTAPVLADPSNPPAPATPATPAPLLNVT